MCGIAGIVLTDKNKPIDKTELENMTNSIYLRGPDDEGYYVKENVGFGFRRLSIIDLHTGHQPLANEDDSIWIIFNGEIYNYQELRAKLVAKGHLFKTNTDTEVIVHLYEEYGKDCVKHLRGMFGFAIWDDNEKKLFCARDRFGIKPFHYYQDRGRLLFGSELKVITSANNIATDIDLLAMDTYLSYGYIAGERSIYSSIKKLKPGHLLEFSPENGEMSIEHYWKINFQPDTSKSEDEWCEEINEVLKESVKMRMISDVPLGAFLSGGIDSSSVVALMAQQSNQPIKTFSIGFKEQQFNELQYAREVANKYGTDHHEHIIEPESVDLLPKLVHAYDEPFADSSAIPTYYVCKFAREHVTVALSGDGGDELFAGYRSYPKLSNIYNYNRVPHGINKLFWGSLYKSLPASVKGKGITYFLSQPREVVAAYFSIITQPERKILYNDGIWDKIRSSPAEQMKVDLIKSFSSKEFISRMQQLDMTTYMPDDILTKVDRVSMYNSLEVRVPILDHKFAELSFRIPSNLKLNGQSKKYLLKKAMTPHLPESVVSHKKQGFAVPLKMWFKDDLKEYIYDRFSSSNNQITEYLNIDYINKIIDDHNHGMRDMNYKIWTLLFMDAWLDAQKNENKMVPNR